MATFLTLLVLIIHATRMGSVEVVMTDSQLNSTLTHSEYMLGVMMGTFGTPRWVNQSDSGQRPRIGRQSGTKYPSRWPNGRIPYEFSSSISFQDRKLMLNIFAHYHSVSSVRFVPRTEKDVDYLLIADNKQRYGCGCCSLGLGYVAGSGAHVLVLAPVSAGGCGFSVAGGTHELLHILGFSHMHNRADRCNYIDINTNRLKDWGEWAPGRLKKTADFFALRIPYDCSSHVHYVQIQGHSWSPNTQIQVNRLLSDQGCAENQRPQFMNSCLTSQGFRRNGRVINNGNAKCFKKYQQKHKGCVANVARKFATFDLIDPNGRCRENGINTAKRSSHQLSQWDIWAINSAYNGPLPSCSNALAVGDGVCNSGNNHIGCQYDGGDCCLPQARDRECIDPCGVRDKFYAGKNRQCRRAPRHFCSDDSCNVSQSEAEMDAICRNYKTKDNNRNPKKIVTISQTNTQNTVFKNPPVQNTVFTNPPKQNTVFTNPPKQKSVFTSPPKQNTVFTSPPKQRRPVSNAGVRPPVSQRGNSRRPGGRNRPRSRSRNQSRGRSLFQVLFGS